MVVQEEVHSYMQSMAKQLPASLSESWSEIENLHSKKLWHQLTLQILPFVRSPDLPKEMLLPFFKLFVKDVSHRISPTALMDIAQCVLKTVSSKDEANELLKSIDYEVERFPEAKCHWSICKAHICLRERKPEDIQEAKVWLDTAENILNNLSGVTPVHRHFYELSSLYHKDLGDYTEYYRHSLKFLGCITDGRLTEDMIPRKDQEERALDLCLAALLSKDIYNFGELLENPIIESLTGTPNEWIVHLINVFNSGDVQAFENFLPRINKTPELTKDLVLLRKKLCLLALMELVFQQKPTKRNLTFTAVAQFTKLPEDEVEMLIIKALALGLVKGYMDQVERTVHITWLQPRLLSLTQVGTVRNQLIQWSEDVQDLSKMVAQNTKEICS